MSCPALKAVVIPSYAIIAQLLLKSLLLCLPYSWRFGGGGGGGEMRIDEGGINVIRRCPLNPCPFLPAVCVSFRSTFATRQMRFLGQPANEQTPMYQPPTSYV